MSTVFCNGRFDILHIGHIEFLEWAASLGDDLAVFVNSDASCERVAGKRTVFGQYDRARMLCGLRAPTLVVMFEQDTPLQSFRSVIANMREANSQARLIYAIGPDQEPEQELLDLFDETYRYPGQKSISSTQVAERIALHVAATKGRYLCGGRQDH